MKAFTFPSQCHTRRELPPAYTDYRRFKPHLQKEFKRRCVYCRVPDTLLRPDAFGVDHYRPKSRFPGHATDYKNLFYSCNTCNRRKGSRWWTAGAPFVPNPCDHVMHQHLRFRDDQGVRGVTVHGKFAADLLDLNDPDIVHWRATVQASVVLQQESLKAARTLLKRLHKLARQRGGDQQLMADIAATTSEVGRSEGYLNRLLGLVALP